MTHRDVLSAAMYPKVFDEYMTFVDNYSAAVEKLPTRAFLAPLEVSQCAASLHLGCVFACYLQDAQGWVLGPPCGPCAQVLLSPPHWPHRMRPWPMHLMQPCLHN